jgi:SM-20-related protein
LQTIFNELIDSYLDTNVGISPAFITHSLSANLKLHLLSLFDSNQMIKAGIGINNSAQQDATFRSDQIHWLDRSHQNIYENEFLDIIDSFVLYLNTTCYTGITGYEFHYTLYEKGAYYKKHIDQFLHNKSRAFSMIIYLNEHWVLADGGELCIYLADYEQRISPTEGKSVFFKSSELAHEVLMTNKNRLSITGWFKTGE